MTPEQQTKAQSYLLAIKQYVDDLRNTEEFIFLPAHVCIHLAPDMCWLSIEHEYLKQDIPWQDCNGFDTVEICERKPQPCHTILAKI